MATKKAPTKKNAAANVKPPAPVVDSPFRDGGLHLAVLSVLMDEEVISESKVEKALKGIKGDSEDEILRHGMALLHALPLPAKALAKITNLDFDGGNSVYMTLEECAGTDTGGWTHAYACRSLEGLSALPALESLDLDGHGGSSDEEPMDLSPLANHPSLESVWLCGAYTNAKALETLPKLVKISANSSKLDDPKVLARLRARGVEIVRAAED